MLVISRVAKLGPGKKIRIFLWLFLSSNLKISLTYFPKLNNLTDEEEYNELT